jgi:hypothetical protein
VSDDGSWYVSDDGFIDDAELVDEMAGDRPNPKPTPKPKP